MYITTIIVAMNISNSSSLIFGQRLKEARLAKGLSQKQVGILAGIDEFVASTRMNRYEKGIHQASIEIVQRIASVLDVPLAYFYTEDENLAQLIIQWDVLSIETREQILSIALGNN